MYSSPVSVYNEGSDAIPAYGLMRISADSDYFGGKTFLKVNKPDATYRWVYLVAGPNGVPAQARGVAYFGFDEPLWALWNSSATTPAIGAEFGPRATAFDMQSDFYGFVVVGKNETSPVRRVLVKQVVPAQVAVQLANSLSYQGSSASAKVLRFVSGSSQPDSGLTLPTLYDYLLESGQTVATNSYGIAGRFGGRAVLTGLRGCP